MRRSTSKKILTPDAARRMVDDYHFSVAQVAHAYQQSEIVVWRYLRMGRHIHQQQVDKSS